MNPVFIVSAGRPHCATARLLTRIGFDGFLVAVSEEDGDLEAYRANWGDRVVTYSYGAMAASTDLMDNFNDEVCGAAPARNGVWSIAEAMGAGRFWMLDDDMTAFTLPKPNSKSRRMVKGGDELKAVMAAMDAYADAAGIDCIGGACDMQGFPPSAWKVNHYVRQCYSLKTSSAVRFRSRMEEDLAFSCDMLRRGAVPMALCLLGFKVKGVCEERGGCTTIYEKNGTVRRAAYNVLACPHTRVKCDIFGYSGFPQWKRLVPKVVSGRYAHD